MQYQLSDVGINDADALVRQCQFPAMRQDPLRKIMFPEANMDSYGEEEEIRWTVEGLKESLENESCYFRKVTLGSSYVGFAVWTFETGREGTRQKGTSNEKRKSWNPAALDFEAWNQVSKRLREERLKVLLGQQNIWRLNTISVAPEHQRKGVGYMLLRWGCDIADSCSQNSFVMASPDGVPLYRRFDFKAVGEVRTEHGTFTSMFRKSRPLIEEYTGQEKQVGFVHI